MDLCVNLGMAKATKKKKKPNYNITVKADLTADQLLSMVINTPIKNSKVNSKK